MKKQDLETGMKIVTREAKEYIVFLNTGLEFNPSYNFVLSCDGWNLLDSYDDNLINCNENTEFDVLKVYKPSYANSIKRVFSSDSRTGDWVLIWERKDESKESKSEERIKRLESELKNLKSTVHFLIKFRQ